MQNQKPDPKKQPKVAMRIKWEHDVKNPENAEFVKETADDLGKRPKSVTQADFNRRYEIEKTKEFYDYDVPVPKKMNIKLRSPIEVRFKNPFKSNQIPQTIRRTAKEVKEEKNKMK